MILFKHSDALNDYLAKSRRDGKRIGFVPTMGALHAGHISLIRASVSGNDLTVCSIFVNPAQFNDPADFEKYPVTINEDIQALEEAGCDLLLLPSVKEIYPDGLGSLPHYDLGYLESILEGKFRPGHFQGVCQVVDRLLDIVNPDMVYLGQKDFQQCKVIGRLLAITGRTEDIRLHIHPTLREPDGLAMSSRNLRLDTTARAKATAIYRQLMDVLHQLQPGSTAPLLEAATSQLVAQGFRVDYVAVAASDDLSLIDNWDGKREAVILAAAYINGIRLIDNLLFNQSLNS